MAEQPRIAELWMEVLVYGGEVDEYLAKESKVIDHYAGVLQPEVAVYHIEMDVEPEWTNQRQASVIGNPWMCWQMDWCLHCEQMERGAHGTHEWVLKIVQEQEVAGGAPPEDAKYEVHRHPQLLLL